MFKKEKSQQNTIATLIGTGCRIEGNLICQGGLRIDGEVIGNILEAEGQEATIVIGENARITGEVIGSHLIVNGTIEGPVSSSKQLELQSRARIDGNVSYQKIEMQLGAIVHGRLSHQDSVKTVELKLAVG